MSEVSSLVIEHLRGKYLELVDELDRNLTLIVGIQVLLPLIAALISIVFNVYTTLYIVPVTELILAYILYSSTTSILRRATTTFTTALKRGYAQIVTTPESVVSPFHYLYEKCDRNMRLRLKLALLNMLSEIETGNVEYYLKQLFTPRKSSTEKIAMVHVENFRRLLENAYSRLLKKWTMTILLALIVLCTLMPTLGMLVIVLFKRSLELGLILASTVIPLLVVYLLLKRQVRRLESAHTL